MFDLWCSGAEARRIGNSITPSPTLYAPWRRETKGVDDGVVAWPSMGPSPERRTHGAVGLEA